MKKILVLFAHPVYQTSILNQSLLASLPDTSHITIHDLYECYPNFMIDVEHEQKLLDSHDVIIFQHPMYWYSSPSLLKEWMDVVLEYGYAFGANATALKGKKFISVITAGGDEADYQGDSSIRNLLKPFEYTAKLCNMIYTPPFVIYSGHKIKAKNFDASTTDQYLPQQVKSYQRLIDDLLNDKPGIEK